MNSLVHTFGDQGLLFREIESERDRQDAKWGGASHDDEHATYDWAIWIRDRATLIAHGLSAPERRRLLVEIAALAVAAIESHDRKQRATSSADVGR